MVLHFISHFIRSTPKSRPNNMGLRCQYVHPSVSPSARSFSDSDEIWYVGRGRCVMHNGMCKIFYICNYKTVPFQLLLMYKLVFPFLKVWTIIHFGILGVY